MRLLKIATHLGVGFFIAWIVDPRLAALLAICLFPVLILWGVRLAGDTLRRRRRTQVLQFANAQRVVDCSALERELKGFDPALRDWLMRGHLTGVTDYWILDAWSRESAAGKVTLMDFQNTPGYQGVGIPLWRTRHGVLLMQRDVPWPVFVVWRKDWRDSSDNSILPVPQRAINGKDYTAVIGNLVVTAPQPALAMQAVSPLLDALGLADDADIFVMSMGHSLLLVLRKQPPDALAMPSLLEVASAALPGGSDG